MKKKVQPNDITNEFWPLSTLEALKRRQRTRTKPRQFPETPRSHLEVLQSTTNPCWVFTKASTRPRSCSTPTTANSEGKRSAAVPSICRADPAPTLPSCHRTEPRATSLALHLVRQVCQVQLGGMQLLRKLGPQMEDLLQSRQHC